VYVLEVKTQAGWRKEMESVDREVVAEARASILAVLPGLPLRIRQLC
jgi:hypothetical protein